MLLALELTNYQFICVRFGHKRADAAEPFCVRQIRMAGTTNFQSIRHAVGALCGVARWCLHGVDGWFREETH